jgi:hypothetical protein
MITLEIVKVCMNVRHFGVVRPETETIGRSRIVSGVPLPTELISLSRSQIEIERSKLLLLIIEFEAKAALVS